MLGSLTQKQSQKAPRIRSRKIRRRKIMIMIWILTQKQSQKAPMIQIQSWNWGAKATSVAILSYKA